MSLIGVTRRIRHKNNDGTIIEAEIGAYARNVSEDEDHRFVTDKEKNGWNDKVSASGGDISDTKAAEFETSSASFPIPAAGETVKVILGKIKKHLEDLASWRPTVSLIANIVDNCTSTNTDKPLSAKQGKVLQDQITQVNSDKADKNNPTLTFMIVGGDTKAEIRRTGSTSDGYGLSIVIDDGETVNYYHLVKNDGSRDFPPIKHTSTDSTYGPGSTVEFGHCKSINDLTHNGYIAGECLSAYQGYRLDQKFGNIQIMGIQSLSLISETFPEDGQEWTGMTATASAVPGATGYYFIPLSCNYGIVTQVSVSGRTISCNARNVSGEAHSCTIRGLVIAYKTV